MIFYRILQHLLLSYFLFSTSHLIADNQLELMYSAANPDYKPFESTYGFAIGGNFDFENGLFLSGYYNETDFTGSGPKVSQVKINSWLEAGIGYAFDHDWGQFYSLITVENIETENKTYDGYGAHFGYRNSFADNWTGVIQFGVISTEFDDWQLIGKLQYDISDNLGLTLGLRDYDKWDYTNYEAGIVFRF